MELPYPSRKAVYIVLLAIAVLASTALSLSGCAALAPALTPSHVTTEFVETVNPDGSMSTSYKAESKGNVDVDTHAYHGEYGPDTVTVDVGRSTSGVDTRPQIEATTQLATEFMRTIASIIPLAMPVATGGGTPAAAVTVGPPLRDVIEEYLRTRTPNLTPVDPPRE